jgi:1-acyl-sn-glycerol-3-phosphate acyltransferase
MIRRFLGRMYLKSIGWTVEGTPPKSDHVGVLLAAPHTSSHDFLLMLSTAWSSDIRVKYLAKKELYRGPVGLWWRFTGGIKTDRQNPGSLLEDLTNRARSGEAFALVIAPEGTRHRSNGWKSGFYRIAVGADIPVTPCSVDSATKQICLGPELRMTGDVVADMDRLRNFYADKGGVNPAAKSPVRLAMESEPIATDGDIEGVA